MAPTGPVVPPAPIPSPGGSRAPPPPPPPPPPESLMATKNPPAPSEKPTMGAVFSQINQGEGITSSLKHVDKSEMTHKNPALRKKTSPHLPPKPMGLKRNPSGGTSRGGSATKATGNITFEGVKWVIVWPSKICILILGKL